VVGTHPHDDHIGGMAAFLDWGRQVIGEYWDPGYYHPSAAYMEVMRALEMNPQIAYTQPTSGMTRFLSNTRIMTLSPAIGLRNRFDSYGVEINNSSISVKIDFPVSRVEQRDKDRRYVRIRDAQALILGGDAQTLSWSQVLVDFPDLQPDNSPIAKELRMALGNNPLSAQVFKVSHHASKHGINLELIELIKPKFSLVSSVAGGGKYNFPHLVALESIREGLEATTSSGAKHQPDHQLGLHYTGAKDSQGQRLGSMAMVISPTGRKRHLWRFGDAPGETVDLTKARLFQP
jgi:competence protein ComEC